MSLVCITAIIGLVLFLARSAELIYRFQIKEYRFDRMGSFLRESGYIRYLFSMPYRTPAKTLRNGIIATIVLLSGAAIYLPLCKGNLISAIGLAIIYPLVSFVMVAFGVAVTSILAHISRERIIARAAQKVEESNCHFVAVSGSYGKSSVKELLYTVLSQSYPVAKTDENMNTDIGVALSVLKNVKKDTTYFIAEMGAYRIGEVAKICSFIKPSSVILTAFGNQHVDLYGSIENLVQAESEPLLYLSPSNKAYINRDIPQYEAITKEGGFEVRTYGMEYKNTDIKAQNITMGEWGTKADIILQGVSYPMTTQLLGTHSVLNILPVVLFAVDAGMDMSTILAALSKIPPITDKLSLHTGKNEVVVLSDSNNSNVEGFITAIEVLSTFSRPKKIILTRGIIELGKEKKPSYRRIIDALPTGSGKVITIWTTDRMFATVAEEMGKNKYIQIVPNDSELTSRATSFCDSDTIILLEGRMPPGLKDRILS